MSWEEVREIVRQWSGDEELVVDEGGGVWSPMAHLLMLDCLDSHLGKLIQILSSNHSSHDYVPAKCDLDHSSYCCLTSYQGLIYTQWGLRKRTVGLDILHAGLPLHFAVLNKMESALNSSPQTAYYLCCIHLVNNESMRLWHCISDTLSNEVHCSLGWSFLFQKARS